MAWGWVGVSSVMVTVAHVLGRIVRCEVTEA